MQDLPKGREVESNWSVNALGGMLSGLQLDQVTAEKNIDWSKATHLRVLTADGVEVNADLAQVKDKSWIRLSASAYTANPAPKAEEKAEKGQPETKVTEDKKGKEEEKGQAEKKAEEEKTKEEKAAADLAKRVGDINRRVQGWAYAIPQYKSQVMTKRMKDLLKPKKKK